MSETYELESNFPANVKLKGKDNEWKAVLTRKTDGEEYIITSLEGITAAECYTKFGAKVPQPIPEPATIREALKRTLSDGLTSLSGRVMVSVSEVEDMFLDALNHLGHEDETEEEKVELDG